MNRLIIGDGLLGSELVKQTGWDYISRKKDNIDFVDINSYKDCIEGYNEIINCVAFCDTYGEDKKLHWNVNYKGVVNLVDHLVDKNIKLIHVSTDYLYANSKSDASEDNVPVHCASWYGYTKLLSDAYVQLKLDNYLVFRCTHKEKPFSYSEGLINQIGNFEYVDKVSETMIDLINGGAVGVYNIGSKLKTMYDLANETRSDVVPVNKKFHPDQPLDVSMNLNKLNMWKQRKK